jgi:hypothetical protein
VTKPHPPYSAAPCGGRPEDFEISFEYLNRITCLLSFIVEAPSFILSGMQRCRYEVAVKTFFCGTPQHELSLPHRSTLQCTTVNLAWSLTFLLRHRERSLTRSLEVACTIVPVRGSIVSGCKLLFLGFGRFWAVCSRYELASSDLELGGLG